MSPLGSEGALLPRPLHRIEKLVSGYCALKKVNGIFFMESFPKKMVNSPKRSTKIALGVGTLLYTSFCGRSDMLHVQ